MDELKFATPDIEIGALELWVGGWEFPRERCSGDWFVATARCVDEEGPVTVQGPFLRYSELATFLEECRALQDSSAARARLFCIDQDLRIELTRTVGPTLAAEIELEPDSQLPPRRFHFAIPAQELAGIVERIERVLNRFPHQGH